MRAWALKKACIAATKSNAVKWWLREFNDNGCVPCTVRVERGMALTSVNEHLKEGNTYIELFRPDGNQYNLQVPIEAVWVEHKWFKHTIRLSVLPKALEVMRESASDPIT